MCTVEIKLKGGRLDGGRLGDAAEIETYQTALPGPAGLSANADMVVGVIVVAFVILNPDIVGRRSKRNCGVKY